MIYIFFILFVFIPSVSYASAEVNYWGYTLKAFGSLLLVFGLIIVFFYIIKKVNNMGKFSGSRIKLKGKLYLDNKRFLSIIEVDGKEFLIGVGETITVLKEINEDGKKD